MGVSATLRAAATGRLERNVGGTDRLVRFVVGPALVLVGAAVLVGILSVAPGWAGTGLAVGAVLVGGLITKSAVSRQCPGNALLGRNTCSLSTDD